MIAGAMAADGFFSPWTAFAVVAVAAMLGDLTGFTLGHTKGQAVLARWAFARRQYEKHRERLEYYFEHFGGATVFVGRFVAVGRAFVPFAAGLSGMPTAQLRADRGTRRTGLGLVHGRPRLYLGLELAAGREMAPLAQHRHHRIGYPDRHHGRAVAIGCPPSDRGRRLLESAFHRTLRLQPQSFRRFRPRPLVAAQLPRPSSHGRLDRDRRAGLDVRRDRESYLGAGSARRDRPHRRALRRQSAHHRPGLRRERGRAAGQSDLAYLRRRNRRYLFRAPA